MNQVVRTSLALILFSLLTINESFSQIKNKNFAFVLKGLVSDKIKTISVDEAYKSSANFLFVDAREQQEYSVSHIAKSIFVGYNNFSPDHLKNVPKDKPVIVYCSIGKRSENIGEKLIKLGFTNVSNLYGGIFEWVNHNYPVYDLQNKQTENVHAYNKLWGRFVDKGTKVY